MTTLTINHAHLFCGLGGGAKGFNAANPRVGNMQGVFRCLGGIDVDPAAVRDFERLSGTTGTVLDLFSREQYGAFHEAEPPRDWREATVADIHAAFDHQTPHILFLSAPCKGFSGLLSQKKSSSTKYQALNELTLRGIWLAMEAYTSDPVPLLVFENVPRIQSRGRHLLDQITGLLRHYGYAVAETTHDCGHLGGLAQSRKRFLLVARHVGKVPSFLYQPDKRPLRAVGDVLSRMPLPGAPGAGPMHRIPALQWKTWVRLAFVEAGSDWRSLNKLAVVDGHLRDYGIVPERVLQNSVYGVVPWSGAVGTVRGRTGVGNGPFSVADPRTGWTGAAHQNLYRIIPWEEAGRTITGATHPAGAALCVADPRPGLSRKQGDPFHDGGHYGVVPWTQHAGAVSAAACHDNGFFNVADPRVQPRFPEAAQNCVAIIRTLDGTWHRPFTTLELAALQGLIDPEDQLELDGLSDSAWRERIGNAVPPPAAQAIAEVMGQVLLLSAAGETFTMSQTPIWVRPMTAALMATRGML